MRIRSAHAVAVAAVAVSACVLTGCTSVAPDLDATTRARGSGQAGAPGAAASSGEPAPTTAQQLAPAFSELTARTGSELVLAWAPVGRPEAVQVLGSASTFDAWSTIKVPIALAAVQKREGALPASAKSDMVSMLTHSDNNSASRMFAGLKQFGEPAAVVEGVLASAGDTPTKVDRSRFGLTEWRPSDAARFASMLPCSRYADEVLETMKGVVADQRWGLGAVEGSRFKGGWGRSSDGYLVRQVGVVLDGSGAGVGVSLLTQPKAGTHAAGTATLSEAATWLQQQLTPADSGTCPATGGTTASP